MARVPVSAHQTAFWTAFDGFGRNGAPPSRADGPNRHLFPHFNPSDATPRRRLVYHGSGVTASPVCSPSGWTKEYEIYGGVGFSGENAQIVASTAAGWGSSNEGLGFNPARPSPAPTSFDDPISGLRVATSLAPRQLGRHHQPRPFFVLRTVAKGLPVVEVEGRGWGEGGLWLWSGELPGARYAGSGSPTGRPGGGQRGGLTPARPRGPTHHPDNISP